MKDRRFKNIRSKLFYVGVLILSVLFLFFGNIIASGEMDFSEYRDDTIVLPAVVTEVTDSELVDLDVFPGADDGFVQESELVIIFNARITGRGERRGDVVEARQEISAFVAVPERAVEAGDRVLIVYDTHNSRYAFDTYQRATAVFVLGGLFLIGMIIFGRKKGFNSIIALGFICMAVFLIFIPAILSGRNIYLATAVILVYSICSTLLIVIGPNKKAVSAMIGCLGGVLFAGLIMFLMDLIIRLTGVVNDEASMLVALPIAGQINLRAIIFAGVVIGAAGAIMDVAMSIASSLWEVRAAGGAASFSSLLKSGLEIGKDILGTMINTLVLAYIGSSLSMILLLSAHSGSMLELLNTEMIVVELLRAIVGSFGMFLTIPLTVVICGVLYTRVAPTKGDEEVMGEEPAADLDV